MDSFDNSNIFKTSDTCQRNRKNFKTSFAVAHHSEEKNLHDYSVFCVRNHAFSKSDHRDRSAPLFSNPRRNVFEIDNFMFYDKNDLWPPLPLNLFVTNSQIYYYGISTVSFYRPHLCRASLKKLQFSTKVLKFGTFFL